MLFRIPVLGGLQDHGPHFCDFGPLLGSLLETILVTFGVPFLHRFSKVFQGQSRAGGGGDLGGIWGPVTGLHQQDKQIYRWKSADL